MNFALFFENFENTILFVEDMPMRTILINQAIKASAKKGIIYNHAIAANTQDAFKLINAGKFSRYSLDYNIENGETSEDIARALAQQGNTGENVNIHSDDPDGQKALLQILPRATVMNIDKYLQSLIRG